MKNIVLVGFMGTGKTTTGMVLAEKLNLPFIDIDRKIETECGMTVADIFKKHGEAFFRQIEKSMIREGLPSSDTIIATGGGAVLFTENIFNLKRHGTVICLQASVDVIIKRIEHCTDRPLLNAPDRAERIAKLLQERAARYQMADYSIDTSALAPDEVAETIIALVQEKAARFPMAGAVYGYSHR